MEQGMEGETSMDLELEDSFETDHNEIEMQVEEVANGSSFSNAEALMENIKFILILECCTSSFFSDFLWL